MVLNPHHPREGCRRCKVAEAELLLPHHLLEILKALLRQLALMSVNGLLVSSLFSGKRLDRPNPSLDTAVNYWDGDVDALIMYLTTNHSKTCEPSSAADNNGNDLNRKTLARTTVNPDADSDKDEEFNREPAAPTKEAEGDPTNADMSPDTETSRSAKSAASRDRIIASSDANLGPTKRPRDGESSRSLQVQVLSQTSAQPSPSRGWYPTQERLPPISGFDFLIPAPTTAFDRARAPACQGPSVLPLHQAESHHQPHNGLKTVYPIVLRESFLSAFGRLSSIMEVVTASPIWGEYPIAATCATEFVYDDKSRQIWIDLGNIDESRAEKIKTEMQWTYPDLACSFWPSLKLALSIPHGYKLPGFPDIC